MVAVHVPRMGDNPGLMDSLPHRLHMSRSLCPPRSVVAAAWLLMAYGVLSLLRLWWFGAGLPTTLTGALIWAVAVLLFALVSWLVYRGNNIVRWGIAVLVAVSAVLMPIYKPELPAGVHLPLYLLQFVLPVLATVLMFLPSARPWFGRSSAGRG